MEMTRTFHAPDRPAWRLWLEQHHATEQDVWLIYTRPGSGETSVSYEESVEEALCFGWVDSLIQKIDARHYARKFTPRRPGSNWSDTNKRRLAKVLAEGRMTPAGMAKVGTALDEMPTPAREEADNLPTWLVEGMQASPMARENFSRLPRSHQRRYIAWLSSAKKEETRQKNLRKAIEMLERNQRLEMNTRTGS
jgi:uncharacterized protein YdeI (YjbR/CyaY-like superfamily)